MDESFYWKILPNHLLDSVLEKLASDDLLRFSLICMSWNSVTKDNPRRPTPMANRAHGTYTTLRRIRIQGCEENENSVIRLPLQMPPLPRRTEYWARRYDRYVRKATISADPVLNADECIVEVIFGDDGFRLAKDKTWTYRDHRTWHFIDDVVHFRDEVYCVDTSNRLNLDGKIIEQRIVRERYLMERKGNGRRYPNFVIQNFEIFRWNFEESKWIEMISLADVALFVGANDSIFVLTSKLPGYYDVYNLKTQSISKPYTPHALTLLNMTKQKSIRFLPTLCLRS
ncbi:F-box protein [Pyrus ussuriensis x Pyrus communis]|uniref:F-box protein n=1 Tax=Pyrus ussuriensis x Pyrus communis TaxID=2448454 RepID=A0A5N5F8P5_9ROSA|nr:F-box protein [Pyrus ussuriensis x Pyrus communis]